MATYRYSGFDRAGQADSGILDAADEGTAFDLLQSRGITLSELVPASESTVPPSLPWYRRDISFRSKQLPLEEQAATANLLASLFGAEISIAEVIRITALSSNKPEIRRQFERIGQRVAEGSGFAEAFEAENKSFSPLFAAFLKVSESSNSLPLLLKALAEFLFKQNVMRQKVLSALIYPSILVLASLGLLMVVVLYLAPNLAPLFSAVDRPPPDTLAALLSLNRILVSYGVWLLLALTGVVVALLGSSQTAGFHNAISRMQFRLPILGQTLRYSALSQLAQAIELLLRSGMPLSEAFRQATQSLGQTSGFQPTFLRAADAVDHGLKASSALVDDPQIPVAFKEMFQIGEETNRLPSTLKALSETLSAQADRQAQRMLSLLTPMLTLILGGGVGFLIYTLMGAILEINEIAF